MKQPKALPEKKKNSSCFITISLLIFVVSTVFYALLRVYAVFFPSLPEIPSNADSLLHRRNFVPPADLKSIITNTSIAFYVIAGASQTNLNPDLRGRFWEFQLSSFTGNYSLQYLSDGPLTTNGIDFLVLPAGSKSYEDSRFCIRTPESWRHFIRHNSQMRWYFRGTHDTFVNLTALSELITDLEAKNDPMTKFSFAFNFHEYGNMYYPHGGTGWLFSNYAVHRFVDDISTFIVMCRGSYDDVALSHFFKRLGLDVMDWQTNKFIVTFPNHMLDVIWQKKWNKVRMCPDAYHLFPGSVGLVPGRPRVAASIHMHRVPMDEAWRVLSETPVDFAVYFPNPNLPTFCQLP
jgi:hypothetical protein